MISDIRHLPIGIPHGKEAFKNIVLKNENTETLKNTQGFFDYGGQIV